MNFCILEMGGTINGIVDPLEPPPTHSRVVEWLQRRGLNADGARIIAMKDSRLITDADRDCLLAAIDTCDTVGVLIPHGTYTMPESGEFLQSQLGLEAGGRCVVLVGSLIPLDEPDSDAPEMLKLALEVLEAGRAGIWMVMSHQIWRPGTVRKDLDSGRFVPV